MKDRNTYKNTDTFSIQGEFYPPENYEDRVSGRLHYDPYWGAKLNFVTKSEKIDSPVLHGVLEDGSICTLFGPFHIENGNRFRNRKLTILSVDMVCTSLLFGEHIDLTKKFTSIDFKPLNMEGFFTNQANASGTKSRDRDFTEYELDNFRLKVTFNNKLKGISSLSANLYSDTEYAEQQLDKLDEHFNSLTYKPELWIRLGYESIISIEYDTEKLLSELIADICNICNFFAISIQRPVIAENITIEFQEGDNNHKIKVFPSEYIEESTLRIALSETPRNFGPVTLQKLDLGKVINNWFKLSFNTRTIVAQVQRKRELRSIDEVYGGIVVLATHLEDILNEDKKSNANIKLKKYDYSLHKYGNEILRKKLIALIGDQKQKTLGERIGLLRGEIAHVGVRQRPITARLGIMDLIEVEHLLRIVVCAFLLSKSGVDSRCVDEYLNCHTQ
ncbi:hypothetical protein [Paraglaciecola sp. 2405UD69-4]|uniref:ApeA N-terminal domain 1-containing protein n=1 Tax=Paraglaciecola sp. 2405UD69-4 TaxID=3391836 RepID=UPI0039C945FD